MNWVLRILVIVVVVLVGAQLGGAWYLGGKAKDRLDTMAENQEKLLQEYAGIESTIEFTEYERGWFSSSAKYAFSLTLPNMPQEVKIDFDFPVDVSHGPLLFGKGGFGVAAARVSFEADVVEMALGYLKELGMPDDVSIEGEYDMGSYADIGFDGAISSMTIGGPGGLVFKNEEDGEQAEIALGKIKGTESKSADLKKSKGKASLESFSVTVSDMGEVMSSTGTGFDYDLEIAGRSLALGTFAMTQDEIKVPSINGTFADSAITSETTANDERTLLNSEAEFKIGDSQFAAGPGLDFHFAPFSFGIGMRSISVEAFQDYQREIQELQAVQQLPNDDPAKQQKMQEAMVNLLAAANKALAENPEFEFTEFLGVPDNGDGEAKLVINFDEGTQIDPNAPEAFMMQVNAQGDMRVAKTMVVHLLSKTLAMQMPNETPENIANMANATVDQMVAQSPFVTMDGDNLVSSMTFDNGQLSVNGMTLAEGEELAAGAMQAANMLGGLLGGGHDEPVEPMENYGDDMMGDDDAVTDPGVIEPQEDEGEPQE